MRPLFRRLSYEHVAVPGRRNRSTQHLRGRTICRDSGVYVQDADDLILRFDLYQLARTKSEHRSWVVCNLPSMNGNRAHLGSTAALAQATEDLVASGEEIQKAETELQEAVDG